MPKNIEQILKQLEKDEVSAIDWLKNRISELTSEVEYEQ
jgi:hypothetical protein